MDTEVQPTPTQENGAKIEESSSDPPGEGPKGKEDASKSPRITRQTRSQTPQKSKEKNDEKLKKTELKVVIKNSKSSDQNGHSEKNADSSESKGNKKGDQKDDKSKKQESPKFAKSSESKDNKNDDSSGTSKKVGNLSHEQKDDKSKKQESLKFAKSSEGKDSKNEESNGTSKKVGNLSRDDNNKNIVDSEKKKSESSSKKHDKNESSNIVDSEKKKSENSPKKHDKRESSNIVDLEKRKSESSPKRHNKKESSKQSTSKDVKKLSIKETNTVESEGAPKSEGEGVDMDPLILATDEPDPELQFDENSDLESGKGSPVLSRCKTRRSHTRNIPTPKTPKSTDSECEKDSIAPTPIPENLNDTNDSLNISTRAEVGSDVTSLVSMANDATFLLEDNSYLNYSRDKSLRETLRSLSPRKTIRPLNDAYRQRAFQNNQNKSDLNIPYSEQDSVNRITGIKRKRSSTPEERKKFKPDSAGFFSYLSSPITNFKNRFIADPSSSTPKLTGYKDSRKNIHEDISYTEIVSEASNRKNNLCAIM